MGPSFTPIKSCILNQNLQKPTPRNQENSGELGCNRLAKVACYTDKCAVQFRIWPVDDSKNMILEVYLFYMVFVRTVTVTGPMQPYLAYNLGTTTSSINLVWTLGFLGYLIGSTLTSHFFNKHIQKGCKAGRVKGVQTSSHRDSVKKFFFQPQMVF